MATVLITGCSSGFCLLSGLRHLAGGDAHMIATGYRLMEFEGFEQAMRQSLDWWD